MGVSVATDDRGGRIRDQRLFFFCVRAEFPDRREIFIVIYFFFPRRIEGLKGGGKFVSCLALTANRR